MNDIAAVRVLEGILTKSSSVIDDMLDHHGVVRVAGLEPNPQTDSEGASSDEDTGQSVPHVALPPSAQSPSTPVRRGSSASAFYSGSAPNSTSREGFSSYTGDPFTPQSSQTFTGFSGTPRSTLSPFPEGREVATPEISTSLHEYRALLDRVIRAASRAQFPRPGVPLPELASDSNDDTPVVLSDTVFGRRSDGKVGHDVKIGAAGELYVSYPPSRLLLHSRVAEWVYSRLLSSYSTRSCRTLTKLIGKVPFVKKSACMRNTRKCRPGMVERRQTSRTKIEKQGIRKRHTGSRSFFSITAISLETCPFTKGPASTTTSK